MTFKTRRRGSLVNHRARALRDGDNMAEALLWNELKSRKLGGYKFVRQFPIGPYFADFLCRTAKLVVELDGSQHAGSAYDLKRDDYMRGEGYSVLRFWSCDIVRNMREICETILAALEGRMTGDIVAADVKFIFSPGGLV